MDAAVIQYYRRLLRTRFEHAGSFENPSILLDAIMETFYRGPAQCSGTSTRVAEAAKLVMAHVLVVEDNEINQMVAKELLEGFGLVVEIVSNGKQAVNLLEKGSRKPGSKNGNLIFPAF